MSELYKHHEKYMENRGGGGGEINYNFQRREYALLLKNIFSKYLYIVIRILINWA